jgi:hypothetical protein
LCIFVFALIGVLFFQNHQGASQLNSFSNAESLEKNENNQPSFDNTKTVSYGNKNINAQKNFSNDEIIVNDEENIQNEKKGVIALPVRIGAQTAQTDTEKTINVRKYFHFYYDDFLKTLDYSSDEKEEVITLISQIDRSFLDAWDTQKYKTSEEQLKHIRDITEEREKKLKDFVGESIYNALKEYQKSTPERMIVKEFSEQNNQIDESKKEEMIQTMYKARNQFESKYSEGYSDKNRPEGVSSSDYKNYLIYQSYVTSVKDILSEGTLGKFKENLEKRYLSDVEVSKNFDSGIL